MKLKSIFLTSIFSLFIVSGLWAQEKYEYATLRTFNTAVVFTTSDNQEVTPSKMKEIEKDLLKKLNELSEKGWEVYSTAAVQGSMEASYFLRKKKN